MADVKSAANKSLEEKFSINVITFIKGFYTTVKWFYDNKEINDVDPELISLAAGIIEAFDDKKSMINKYIEYSHDKWPLIKEKNRDFLINHAKTLFGNIPGNAAEIFTKLFKASKKIKGPDGKDQDVYVIGKTYEDSYWQYFESFTKLCIKYIHERRTVGGNTKFFEYVDVKKHAQLFCVDLK
jgi:hypothetical protein